MSGATCTEVLCIVDTLTKGARSFVKDILRIWARVNAVEVRHHRTKTPIWFVTSLTSDTTTSMSGDIGGVKAIFEEVRRNAWNQRSATSCWFPLS